MKTKTDTAWLCDDCTIVAVNGDTTGIESAARVAAVEAGLERLGEISADFNSEAEEGIEEFSWADCDCCRSGLGGGRHRFAVWGR